MAQRQIIKMPIKAKRVPREESGSPAGCCYCALLADRNLRPHRLEGPAILFFKTLVRTMRRLPERSIVRQTVRMTEGRRFSRLAQLAQSQF